MCVLRCYFNAVLVPSLCPPVEKFVFCLTGPYLTRRATIGRQANGPLGLAEGGALDLVLRPEHDCSSVALNRNRKLQGRTLNWRKNRCSYSHRPRRRVWSPMGEFRGVFCCVTMRNHAPLGAALYPLHVPTKTMGKALLAADAAFRAFTNPRDATSVGVLGEVSGRRALQRIHSRMERHPVGRAVLHDRPQITSHTLDGICGLPPHTFGGAYAAFLKEHAFDPDERAPVRFVDDADLAYVMQRYRQVHDLWHTLFGLPPSYFGEVALKWLEAAQTGLPMCVAGAAAGGVRLPVAQQSIVTRHVLPWAARHAGSTVDLMSVYYEREWERPLEELREELRLEMPPPVVLEQAQHTRRRARPDPQ